MSILLSHKKQDELFKEGGYHPIAKLSPRVNPNLNEIIAMGNRIEVLTSYGTKKYFTITSLLDKSGYHIVGKREDGTHRNLEFCIDSSMSDCFDIGWKKIENFPKEIYTN